MVTDEGCQSVHTIPTPFATPRGTCVPVGTSESIKFRRTRWQIEVYLCRSAPSARADFRGRTGLDGLIPARSAWV